MASPRQDWHNLRTNSPQFRQPTANQKHFRDTHELVVAGKVVKGNSSWDGFMIAQTADQPDLDHPDNPDTQDGLECPAGE